MSQERRPATMMLVALTLTGVFLTSKVLATATINVDIQPPGAATADGYVQLTQNNRWDNGTHLSLAGGAAIGWVNYFDGGTRNRTSYGDLLKRDYVKWSSSDPAETLKLQGLAAGSYDLTLYSVDLQYLDKETSFEIDQDNDGVTDLTVAIDNTVGEQQKTIIVTVSTAGVLSITADGIVGGAAGAFNGLDLVGGGAPDTTPPAAVADLRVAGSTSTSLTLEWTAPADDLGGGGAVASYDLRYSTSAITGDNWSSATQVSGEPTPAAPGQTESYTLTGLSPDTQYYFALKSADSSSNISGLSNVPSGTTQQAPDTTPPAAISDLAVSNVQTTEVTLTWTAVGDDGLIGTASSYDIRYSTFAMAGDTDFQAATQVANPPTPQPSGFAESIHVVGLSPGTTYWFAVKASDEVPNSSDLSNVPSASTAQPPDITPPDAVNDLAVTNVQTHQVTLTWTAVGDDGQSGIASSYDIRYSTSAIANDTDFQAATQAASPPVPQSSGSAESCDVTGLAAGTAYWFAVKVSDEVPNTSDLSNVPSAITQSGGPAVDVHVDIEPSDGSTADGYVKLTKYNRWDSGTQGSLGDGIQAGWLNYFDGGDKNRTGFSDLLKRDYVKWSSSDPAETLQLQGMSSGSYELTLYSVDPQYLDKETRFEIDQDNDDVTDLTVTIDNTVGQQEETVAVTVSSAGVLSITANGIVGGAAGAFNGLDLVGGTPDTTPPAAIGDLAVTGTGTSTISLQWTAPADDLGSGGDVSSYDLRYSTSTITEGNWASAIQVSGEPTPAAPGQLENHTVTALSPDTQYYFAMESSDSSSNVSDLSNVALGTTQAPDTTPPAAITDLAVSNVTSSQATLTWTAPGDDGSQGQASQYDVRYSTSAISNDGDFAVATQATGEPAPQTAGSAESFAVSGLQGGTQYSFAVKSLDDGAPPNTSALSNVVSATTLMPTAVAYGISNEFSLAASPSGPPYDPAVPATGDISITNINVDTGQIVRSVASGGPVYEGTITYDISCSATDIFVWLELSIDGGTTWNQRHIHTIGHVGPTNPGTGLSADWLVDGDHGDDCKIRIRVNVDPATYSNFDADNSKYPRPVPWDDYPNIERLISDLDAFDFTDADAALPQVDFYKSTTVGQVHAGFARMRFFHHPGQYVENPIYFLHCAYLVSADGQNKYVVLQGDVINLYTDTVHRWRDQINSNFGIPKDHIMVFYSHVHNGAASIEGVDTFPIELLQTAMAHAVPVEVAFFNQDMGTSHNVHRTVMTGSNTAHSSFGNSVYSSDNNPPLTINWEYDGDDIVGGSLDATPVSSVQTKFDSPLDSYLQMIILRDTAQHNIKAIVVKWTGHATNSDYRGHFYRCVMDTFQNRFGQDVEVMYACGFAGNHRMLAQKSYPAEYGSPRSAGDFADAIESALPTMTFSALTKVGVVAGYDTFGAYGGDPEKAGIDADRLGVGVQVFRFNDIYLSVLPGEAPSEQGLFIRARTSDVDHMYNAYGNTYYDYYSWGRWFHIQHYERSGSPNKYESFRMAQEIVRGVNILEQALGQ